MGEQMEDSKEVNRNKRRDKTVYKRQHGMRVVGQSVRNLAQVIRRKTDARQDD